VAEPTNPVSIRERIVRVICATLAAQISGANVEAWAERNSFDNAQRDGDTLVVAGDESVAEAEGNIGWVDKIMPVQVLCLVFVPENLTPQQMAAYYNRRMAQLEKAVFTNPYMLEAQTEGAPIQLAVKSNLTGTIGPVAEDGSASCAVGIEFDVHYRHDLGNPYQCGTAIPEKSE
jgi:hypothetical protein